jgi:hypothetical protein
MLRWQLLTSNLKQFLPHFSTKRTPYGTHILSIEILGVKPTAN